eukprot:CAMPEP_0172316352 /NCGR_PEP_ID=MMETSP1058-20130122/27900_1 /TAXON_ID=83371 /ORGANISM="Detonula confervacea, Strain CCMP 353" /LENGTH=208 /DNA_ID=CAMNT_0013030641 /DNA_START=223 /DNA_END=849 /DNA_ORIENTATION=+
MKEFKEKQQQDNNGGEMIMYRIYECCYNGSTRGVAGHGYGHCELHLALSLETGPDGHRLISGCGMRELEYTEIVDGYIDSDGNAGWTEKTKREISYYRPKELPTHVGPVSIQSKGKFDNSESLVSFEGEYFGRDECACADCQAFWARYSTTNTDGTIILPHTLHNGEPCRWCPAEESRKIGQYISFRLKEETYENDNNVTEEVYHRMV